MEKLLQLSRPINLLQIIGTSMVGGMETYVLRLIKNLPRNKFRVVCLCPLESSITAQLRKLGCTVHVCPFTDEPDFQSLQFGTTLMRTEGIELIHAHLPNAHLLAGMLGKITQTPVLAHIHGRNLFMRDLEVHRMLQTHLCVVAKSAYMHALSLGISPDKLEYIPNGVDTRIFHQAVKSDHLHRIIDVAPDTPLIGFVGRLSHEKGPEVFLRAAKCAHDRIPDCRFVLIGEGPMGESVERRIVDMGISGFVYLAGLQDNMLQVYASLELVVSTSYSEGMPLAVLEAMASGLPVIATKLGGLVDMVEVNSTGFLHEPGNHEGIAGDIVRVMTNARLRKSLGKAGRRRAKELFDLSGSIERMAVLLLSLHGQRKAALNAAA